MYQPKSAPTSTLVGNNSLVHDQHIDCGGTAMDPVNGGNSLTSNPNLASKQRLRWTHELHERFVDAVAQLGGPDREFFLVLSLVNLISFLFFFFGCLFSHSYTNIRHAFTKGDQAWLLDDSLEYQMIIFLEFMKKKVQSEKLVAHIN